MAEKYVLGVGFYPVDPDTAEPLSGPHYTRQEALNTQYDAEGGCRPCFLLEVVGDWQAWLNPGAVVPRSDVAEEPTAPVDELATAEEVVVAETAADDSGNVAATAAESAE